MPQRFISLTCHCSFFLNLLSLRYKTIVSGIVVWCRGWSSLGMPASCIIMPDLSTAVLFLFCFLLMHTLRESRWWWLKYLGHWNMGDQSGTQVEFRVPDLTWYSPLQLWVLGEWTNGWRIFFSLSFPLPVTQRRSRRSWRREKVWSSWNSKPACTKKSSIPSNSLIGYATPPTSTLNWFCSCLSSSLPSCTVRSALCFPWEHNEENIEDTPI